MDLPVTSDIAIPDSELEWRFTTSGGPGGQHANRSATRVEVRFDVTRSTAFDEHTRDRIVDVLGPRVTVGVDETRSQWRNRRLAMSRLADLIRGALQPPPPDRRATRPTPAGRRRRLEAKRRRAEVKRARRPPDWE